jgi:hypothetical protein
VDEVWQALERVLDACLSTPVFAKSESVLVDELDRLMVAAQKLAAATLVRVREVDGRGVAVGVGATSTVAWLRDRYRISGGAASRLVTLARALDADAGSPIAEALAAGQVNVEQAKVITDAVAKLPAEHRSAGEEHLVGEAACFGPRELGRLGQRIFEVVAPDEADKQALDELERAERRAWQDRGLWLTDIPGTCHVRVHGRLTHDDAATVRAVLGPLCAPRTRRRTARRHSGAGTDAGAADPAGNGADPADTRSPGQRCVDALIEVCRLVSAYGELPDNGGDRPQVIVTIDYESLRQRVGAGTFDDGSHLSPATARRIACDAGIIPAVLGTASQVLDLGRQSRLATGPLRRALVLRDRGCAFPGCDRPPRWTDAHHVRHWSDGGPTDLSNLVLLCGYHHRLIHHSEWQVKINPKDGTPEFTPPAYIDADQLPRRNRYHRRE